ncbi:MAG: pyridine nucleotide-disulfide oxidoreductase [Bacteroidetes bacterium]|nr:pyridine nucleotide-disulfide oxidoreductase [Bacteroidota bacterium]
MSVEQVDVLVIGAGPSGTVAASIINKAGYKVKIVEKMQFPRFVIGESLLPKCMEPLEEAGFLPYIQAKGFQEKFGAKFVNADKQIMDFNFSDQFTKGWTHTWQVKRADFDHTLAMAVEEMGVAVEYQTTVTKIVFEGTDSLTTVTKADGSEKQIKARFIVDGSGYGRVIPKMFGLERESNLPPRKALFTHIRDVRRLDMNYTEPNRILIVDHSPGVWVWCIPFSDGITSCGFVAEPSFFDSFTGTPEEQLRAAIASDPNIAERFEGCEFMFEPRILQSWSSTCDSFYGDGFVLTGNVTEFLDPIFSSGVTLATVSAQRAAHLVIRQLQGEKVDWQKEYMDECMIGVNAFRTYVMAWYDGRLQKIFFNEQRPHDIVAKICSVLAGYVWDQNNPFVKDSEASVNRLIRLIELNKQITSA